MTADESGTIGIGVVQMEPVLGDLEGNRDRSIAGINAAVEQRADLVVLPELCTSGYVFAGWRELAEYSEPVPGPTTAAWEQLARESGCSIVGGIAQRDGNDYYNAAAVVGPNGLVGVYQKLHLFNREKLFFTPGARGLPVFSLPFGRVGVLICYDLRFVEVTRILAAQGADIIAIPTNWVPTFNRGGEWDAEGYCPQARTLQVLAGMNQVFMAAADRVGTERDTLFLGSSIVAGPWGERILGPTSGTETAVSVCRIDPLEARRARGRGELIWPYAERRTDVYDEFLGYAPAKWQ